MTDWPELEAARRRRDAIRRIEEFVDRRMQQLEQNELINDIEPEEQKDLTLPIQDLFAEWDEPIRLLLAQLAEATWSDKNIHWQVKARLVERSGAPGSILTWQVVLFPVRFFYNTGYYIHMVIDQAYRPKLFLVECGDKDHFVRSKLAVSCLKAALLEAYEAGPIKHLFAQDNSGVPLENK
ncbi:MAG: hypothetical protein P4L50_18080 [Anaerolineaceae bacterium]|nr:hypothetical protein [Anaerolineaceae bacterium]